MAVTMVNGCRYIRMLFLEFWRGGGSAFASEVLYYYYVSVCQIEGLAEPLVFDRASDRNWNLS